MSQLPDILQTNAECLAILRDRIRDAPDASAYQAALDALTRARQALINAAFQQRDPDAIAALAPSERRSAGAETNPSPDTGALGMKNSKLVKKAKKIKAKNPGASTADVFGALADDAAAEGDPIGREALGVAGTADTIAKMRRRAGLR